MTEKMTEETEEKDMQNVQTPDETQGPNAPVSDDTPDADASPDTNVSPEPESEEADAEADPVRKARKEAAGYRSRLRQAEHDRDAAHETVTALRTQIVNGQATTAGLKPEALWAAGFTTDDLTDDTGAIDAEKVAAAIQETRERLGITRYMGSADQGTYGRRSAPAEQKPTWGALTRR